MEANRTDFYAGKPLHAYLCEPIDLWAGSFTFHEAAMILTRNAHPQGIERGDKDDCMAQLFYNAEALDTLFARAKELARKIGWEGIIREGPVYFFLPDPPSGDFKVAVAFKQDNNGTSFVVSPIPIHWVKAQVPSKCRPTHILG